MNILDIKAIVNKTRIFISCSINQDNNFNNLWLTMSHMYGLLQIKVL